MGVTVMIRMLGCEPMPASINFQQILDELDTAVVLLNSNREIVWCNAQFQKWFGPPGGTGNGNSDFYAVVGDCWIEGPVFAPLQQAATTGGHVRTTLVSFRDDRCFEMDVTVLPDEKGGGGGYLVTLRDISEERRNQDRLERIYIAGAELTSLNPDVFVGMSYEERLCWVENCIKNHLQGLFGFDAVEIRRLNRKTGELVKLLAIGMYKEAEDRCLRAELEGSGITGYVAATGQAYLCEDTMLDSRYLPGADGARSSLTLPLLFENQVVGTFNVESPRRAAFSPEDCRILERYCRELARALVMLELLEAEKCRAGATKVEEIHSRIADPVDEIYSELLRLQKLFEKLRPAGSEDVIKGIGEAFRHAEELRKVVQEIGQELPPILAVMDQTAESAVCCLRGCHGLVVAEDMEARANIRQILRSHGVSVSVVRTGRAGLVMLEHDTYDFVIVELHLEDMESKEFFQKAIYERDFSPHRLILMSEYGYDPEHNLVAARQFGINAVFLKEKIFDQLVPTCIAVIKPPVGSSS
jgi:CheY-like chemotaxis protein